MKTFRVLFGGDDLCLRDHELRPDTGAGAGREAHGHLPRTVRQGCARPGSGARQGATGTGPQGPDDVALHPAPPSGGR